MSKDLRWIDHGYWCKCKGWTGDHERVGCDDITYCPFCSKKLVKIVDIFGLSSGRLRS